MCGVLDFSGSTNNAVVPPKPLTCSGSLNRVDDDAIYIAFPRTASQNSNSNETEILNWTRQPVNIRFIYCPTEIYQSTLD